MKTLYESILDPNLDVVSATGGRKPADAIISMIRDLDIWNWTKFEAVEWTVINDDEIKMSIAGGGRKAVSVSNASLLFEFLNKYKFTKFHVPTSVTFRGATLVENICFIWEPTKNDTISNTYLAFHDDFNHVPVTFNNVSFKYYPGVNFMCEYPIFNNCDIDALKVRIAWRKRRPKLQNTVIRTGYMLLQTDSKELTKKWLKLLGMTPANNLINLPTIEEQQKKPDPILKLGFKVQDLPDIEHIKLSMYCSDLSANCEMHFWTHTPKDYMYDEDGNTVYCMFWPDEPGESQEFSYFKGQRTRLAGYGANRWKYVAIDTENP